MTEDKKEEIQERYIALIRELSELEDDVRNTTDMIEELEEKYPFLVG